MGKLPPVERDPIMPNGITIECAAKWHLFLAEEYEMLDESDKAKAHRQRGESLNAMPMKGSVSDAELETEISIWTAKRGKSNESK